MPWRAAHPYKASDNATKAGRLSSVYGIDTHGNRTATVSVTTTSHDSFGVETVMVAEQAYFVHAQTGQAKLLSSTTTENTTVGLDGAVTELGKLEETATGSGIWEKKTGSAYGSTTYYEYDAAGRMIAAGGTKDAAGHVSGAGDDGHGDGRRVHGELEPRGADVHGDRGYGEAEERDEQRSEQERGRIGQQDGFVYDGVRLRGGGRVEGRDDASAGGCVACGAPL